MTFMRRIVEFLYDAGTFLYSIFLEVNDWVWPFYYAAEFFYDLSITFIKLAARFDEFREWLEWAEDEIGEILSWSRIKDKIREWLDGIEDLIDWFTDWWTHIKQEVEDWWGEKATAVKGWIEEATEGLEDLLEDWDNFWDKILPELVNFTWLAEWWNTRLAEINSLIESVIKTWFPFYNDLVNLWSDIKVFFADPLQWVYNKLDEFFERFW